MAAVSRTAIRRFVLAGCVLCWGVLAAVSGPAEAETDERPLTIFQWTDHNGNYRYTPERGRVPRYARDSIVTIQAGEAPPSTAPVYFNPDPKAEVITVPSPSPKAGPNEPYRPTSGDQWTEYDARMREVEALIAEYEEALKVMVSAPGPDADTEVSPELREIARRLPQLQAELAALHRGRSDTGGP
ncbi:MAG: hypothetical protein JRG80_20070 [Deltaproteobacteria bacterium]|nr:hypothetical protein [Deltaproteobacteria bacterium]MBW2401521.1 hypothetical protein [Deltaproteobacteria bacterium]